MADDSELDYIRTFIGSVMTGYTIKQFSEVKQLSLINDTQRGLVYPGELLTSNDLYYIKRFKVSFSDTTEVAFTTAFKLLIAGIKNYNMRLAGPTQVSDMVHITLVSGNKNFEHGTTKRWYQDINLDITWLV